MRSNLTPQTLYLGSDAHSALPNECELFYIVTGIWPDDNPLGSKHVAINNTNKVMLAVLTPLIIRKHNGMSDFKISFVGSVLFLSSESPVLYCSDIQRSQVVTAPVLTFLYALQFRKKKFAISTATMTV